MVDWKQSGFQIAPRFKFIVYPNLSNKVKPDYNNFLATPKDSIRE
jgi:hypothetical protein